MRKTTTTTMEPASFISERTIKTEFAALVPTPFAAFDEDDMPESLFYVFSDVLGAIGIKVVPNNLVSATKASHPDVRWAERLSDTFKTVVYWEVCKKTYGRYLDKLYKGELDSYSSSVNSRNPEYEALQYWEDVSSGFATDDFDECEVDYRDIYRQVVGRLSRYEEENKKAEVLA